MFERIINIMNDNQRLKKKKKLKVISNYRS